MPSESSTNITMATITASVATYTCPDIPAAVRVPAIVYFFVVIILGTVGNGMLLVVFASNPGLLKKSMNFLICSNTVVNFITSLLFSPMVSAQNFVECQGRAFITALYAGEYFLQLCAISSIFTLTAVAANQYLLIARPNSTYRTCCTGWKAMACLLLTIWFLAISVITLFWAAVMWKERKKDTKAVAVLEKLFYLPSILNYCPLIAIPCFQCAIIRTIRASRNRIEAVQVVRDTPGSYAPPPPTQTTSICNTDPVSVACESTATASTSTRNNLPGGTGRPRMIQPSSNTTRESEGPVIQREERLVVGRNETRMIKMMLIMYLVLVIVWTPSLLAWILSDDQFRNYLDAFGSFIPVYPAVIPYAFMWTNRKYRTAVWRQCSKLRPPRV